MTKIDKRFPFVFPCYACGGDLYVSATLSASFVSMTADNTCTCPEPTDREIVALVRNAYAEYRNERDAYAYYCDEVRSLERDAYAA